MGKRGHGWLGWLRWPAWVLLLISPLVGGGCISNGPTAGPVGTRRNDAALRQVRVLLSEGSNPAAITVAAPFYIADSAGKGLSNSPAGMSLSLATDAAGGVVINGKSMPNGCRIVPRSDGALQFASNRYHGSLTVLNRGGRLWLVNNLDIEQYLPGVVSAELFPKFHPEAFKAQAVAARTYALYEKFTNPRPDYDVTSTTASQVYIGVGNAKAIEAVKATYGRVLTWSSPKGERIFCTYFSSTCGGVTCSVSHLRPVQAIPPLAGGVRCAGCTHANYYTWQPVTMSRSEITAKLRAKHPQTFAGMGPVTRIEPIQATPEGRVTWLMLSDSRGEQVKMRAADFRLAVGSTVMKSIWCQIQSTPDGFKFVNGRGFGHGVGMCQWGCDGLAQQGWNWKQILVHYYPSAHITRAY